MCMSVLAVDEKILAQRFKKLQDLGHYYIDLFFKYLVLRVYVCALGESISHTITAMLLYVTNPSGISFSDIIMVISTQSE